MYDAMHNFLKYQFQNCLFAGLNVWWYLGFGPLWWALKMDLHVSTYLSQVNHHYGKYSHYNQYDVIHSPFFNQWIKQSIYLSIYLSVCLSIYSIIYLSICLSVYLSVCLSVCPSVCPSIYSSIYLSSYILSICLPIYYLSIYLYIYLVSIYLYIYLSVYLSIYLSYIYLSIYLSIYYISIYPSIYLSIYQSIYLSIYLSIHTLLYSFDSSWYIANMSTAIGILGYLSVVLSNAGRLPRRDEALWEPVTSQWPLGSEWRTVWHDRLFGLSALSLYNLGDKRKKQDWEIILPTYTTKKCIHLKQHQMRVVHVATLGSGGQQSAPLTSKSGTSLSPWLQNSCLLCQIHTNIEIFWQKTA